MRYFNMRTDFDIKVLSLIDVSSEDDCLLVNSSIWDQRNPQFSGSFDENGKLEEDELRGNGSCNLSKSLTCDTSFFSTAAFLEPDEFSSMVRGNEKGEIHTLPGIHDNVNKSYDASTMLDDRASTRESLEADSVEPASYNVKKELQRTDPRTVSSSKKLESTNKDKVIYKGAPKNTNIAVKDLGKAMKQVSSRPRSSQSDDRSIVSTSSLHKLPKGVSRVGPISTPQTKRASLGGKNVKNEKNAKSITGRGTTISKTRALGDLKNTMHRPSSSRSSSLNMINNNSKIVAKGKIRAGQLTTLAKLNSSMSAHSSYSEWSSVSSSSSSSSSTSTSYTRSNNVRATLGYSSRKGLVTKSDAEPFLDSQTHHTQQSDDAEVTGSLAESEKIVSNASTGLLNPISIKPSGIRPPSSKIAFSNGVRLPGHTQSRSMPSQPSSPIGLPKIGVKCSYSSGSLNKAPLRNGPRNTKISTGISAKPQNKPSQRAGRESYLQARAIGSAEKKLGPDQPKLVVKLISKEGARIKDTKIVPLAVPDYR